MLAFHDEFLDGQLLRTLAYARDGGADIGECLVTAATIDANDPESWRRSWTQLADRTLATAQQCEREGHGTSARDAYLRASNYYRTSAILHLAPASKAAVAESYRKQREAFACAAKWLPWPTATLRIPFGSTELHGYLCLAGDGPRPLVITVGGYDSTCEESYFFNARAALERGYHCLTFDGPGQGTALLEVGLAFQPDWGKVISAVIDYAVKRAEVDAGRIFVIGESFGGQLVPLAAASDARIRACVLNPPQFDLWQTALSRLPLPASIKSQLPHGPRWAVVLLSALLRSVARTNRPGWALRRGMLTHGKNEPWEYVADTSHYRSAELVKQIRCPTLVCDAERDELAGQARAFFDLLICDKTYVAFTTREGAGDHCVMGHRSLYHQRVFDWIDERGGAPLAHLAS